MTRREFLRGASIGTISLFGVSAIAGTADVVSGPLQHFEGQEVFDRIIAKSTAQNWKKLPIGEVIGKVAMELKGTPYVGFTLEVSQDSEPCVVTLDGLDCVTFFEDSLDMARMIKQGRVRRPIFWRKCD